MNEDNKLVYFNNNLIVVQFAETRWHGSNKQWYIDRKYLFTKIGQSLIVDVRDLSMGSHVDIIAICPMCKKERVQQFCTIMKTNHTKCLSCASMDDLSGNIFDRLTVIKPVTDSGINANCIIWLCECICGNTVNIRSYSLKNETTRSCGCYQRELTGNRYGENSPTWNPDLTDEERDKRRSMEDNEWSKEIKVKDNYICQSCGQHGGRLVSHHLNGYKDFPEQQCDLDNGVTLCETCHNQFHNGYMGSNRISCQYEDFVSFCSSYYPNALFLQI